MLNYKIEGGSLPVVICYPEDGQTLCSEKGSMSWMSPNIDMNTSTGGGLKKALGRLVTGDSIFMNEYTAHGNGMIAFSSSFPGSVIPIQLEGQGIIVQKKGFLAMEKGLDISIHINHKVGTGLFGGEGFIMQRISGNGMVFLEIDGYCKEYELAAGQSLVVNSGFLAAMSDTCSLDVKSVKGLKNMVFGGEGLFNTVVTGPGKVYLQSMPLSKIAGELAPYMPTPKTVTAKSEDNTVFDILNKL